MNVLVVSRLYPRPTDPVLGIFVEEEARELARHCNIKVVSPIPWFPPLKPLQRWYRYSQFPRRETRDGIEVLRPRTIMFPRNLLFPLYGFPFYLALRRCVREMGSEFPIDLIHAHTAFPDALAAVMLGRALDRPTLITLHGGDVTTYMRRYLIRRQGLWAVSNADRVIAVSNSLRRTLVDEWGAEGQKVTVIPNGVDVSRFTPLPQPEARDRLGLHGDAPLVLYVGAISRPKGIDYLLRAFKLLREDRDSVGLVLVGEGDYAPSAATLARELGIDRSVMFAGKSANEEMPLWMNACDVVVLPSLSEGFGVVLIEAMACGKPVVATACGGPEDIVTPTTGLIVPPGDESALAVAMLEVLEDGDLFRPQVVREHAVDSYSMDKIASRLLHLYEEVA